MTDIDWALLARYAAGEGTAEERADLERQLTATPAAAAQLAAMREVAALGDRSTSARERAQVLAQVRRQVAAAAKDVERVRPRTPWRQVRPVLRMAAVLAAVVGVAALGYVLLRSSPTAVSLGTPSFRTFTTPRAARLSLRLSDGTLVELAPATSLRVPATYGKRDRTVELAGEAMFTVVHDTARPFAVRTARFVARDLGTRFVVREYPGDAMAEVMVAEGRVAITADSTASRPAADRIVLGRGEGVRVMSDGRMTVTRDAPFDNYFAWTQGRLVFRGTPVHTVAAQLGRWFDIDVRLDTLVPSTLLLNASFEQTEAAPAVVQMIADALNLRLVRDGRVYSLQSK